MQGWTPDFIPKLTGDSMAADGDKTILSVGRLKRWNVRVILLKKKVSLLVSVAAQHLRLRYR